MPFTHPNLTNRNEFNINTVKITIIQKPAFEAVGFTWPANLDGGSIARFIKELEEDCRYAKLAATLPSPQQIWVCLSDGSHACGKRFCPVCDMSCAGFDVRCTVCVEKTEEHDFSQLKEDELFAFSVPASEWALFETNPADLHRHDAYKLVGKIGYQWNDRIRLHFDNEHEWTPGKTMHFLLPVIPKK
jgi:hypothetical protein